jgi:hypothetical protein
LGALYFADELNAPPSVRYTIAAAALGTNAVKAALARKMAKGVFDKVYTYQEYLERPWEVRAREAQENGNEFISFDEAAR